MKLIIGLGNPENKYNGTRHNVGFFWMNKLQGEYTFPEFEFNKNFNADITKGRIVGSEVLLVKPQTFMNNSGTATQALLSFYKLTPDDLLVLHDDLDITLGKYKLAVDSSSAGHNGVQDIIDRLGTQKFRRLRIGIGQSADDASTCRLATAHDFVLGKFSPDELEILSNISAVIMKEVEKIIST